MRIFENYLNKKMNEGKDNFIFIDLAYVEKTRGCIEISLGIKEKIGGLLGTTWRTAQMMVEDDFSISEFINTCGKFKLSYSVFCGDNTTYIF